MTDKVQVVLNSIGAREKASRWCMQAGPGTVVEFRRPTRSVQQNSRLWSMLSDVAKQVNWHGNKLSADEWKTVFTASLRKQRVVPGIDGGFVVLGERTSKMSIAQMTELMDLIDAFGAQSGVRFKVFDHYEEMAR